MPKNCAIPGCNSRSDKEESASVSFYRLPYDLHLRHKWLVSIKKSLNITADTRICSLHFEGSKKSQENPIPTIFPWSLEPRERRKPPTQRSFIPPKPKKQKLSDQLAQELEDSNSALALAHKTIAEQENKIKELEASIKAQKVERFGVRKFQGSDGDIRFFTGLPSYGIFMSLFMFLQPLLGQLAYRSDSKGSTRPYKPTPRALEPIDEFFLVLTRLRLGSLEQDLAERFRISTATVSRICTTWIKFLDKQLRPLITWPSRSLIDKHMPSQFRELYPTTRVILDCTEIFTEKPSSLPVQSATYSNYKHHNTFKGLIGISPVGAITFISELYAGSVTDRELTRRSGILDLLEPGDSIMADKGFDITYDVMIRGLKLNIPPFVKSGTQMPKKHVLTTRRIASLRIHVERAIGHVKVYRILHNVVPLSLVKIVEHIWGVCCALSLFHLPLVMDSTRQ